MSGRYEKTKKGECYCKTSSIIKKEKLLLKLNHRLTNLLTSDNIFYCKTRTKYYLYRRSECQWDDEKQAFIQLLWKYQKRFELSDRIYMCECGNVIDRDYQAALNLKKCGENIFKHKSAA